MLAVVRQAELGNLRGIEVALALPLRGHGHPLGGTDTLDTVAHVHVVVLKVHEDAVRIVGGLGIVDLAVAVRPVEPGHAVDGGEGAVHLKVLVEEGERQKDLVALAPATDRVLLVDEAIDFLGGFRGDVTWRRKGRMVRGNRYK